MLCETVLLRRRRVRRLPQDDDHLYDERGPFSGLLGSVTRCSALAEVGE